jgi:isopentenyl-diphosphate delta-isomerase
LPIFRALTEGGPAGADAAMDRIEAELRHAMLLTGSATVAELRECERVIGSPLREWCAAL